MKEKEIWSNLEKKMKLFITQMTQRVAFAVNLFTAIKNMQ